MASGRGNSRIKQKMEEKDWDQGATTAGAAAWAMGWGMSNWSEPEPAHKERAIDIIDHKLPYYTHNTYDVIFFGDSVHTTVTCDPTVVSQWISDIESIHRLVGLDVEWRPSFNRNFNNPAATLQLCVGRRCLIFQLIHSPSIPQSLVNFLANPNYTFVGIGIKQDLEKLEEDYEFGFSTKTVDLRDLAAAEYGRSELKNAGLKTLASLVLQKEVEKPKSVTMSRWDNQWLTPTQVRYACVDAFVCFEIGRILNAGSAFSLKTHKMAPGGGSGTRKPEEEKDATTTAVAVGAAAGVAALAVWGISKWLGSSDPEPAYQRATMTTDIIDHNLPYVTHKTYDVIFYGESIHTTVACDPTVVSQWISNVESIHRLVGLDVEWRPSYNRYINNPAATLQLCVGRRCLIFQLIHSPSIPHSLVNFLANPNYTFVGIGIKQDLEKLEEDYEFGFNTNTMDLRDLAAAQYGRRELKIAGLKALASLVLGKEVEKVMSVTMSPWDNRWLTAAQVKYACLDAFVCFEIGRILNAGSASGRR